MDLSLRPQLAPLPPENTVHIIRVSANLLVCWENSICSWFACMSHIFGCGDADAYKVCLQCSKFSIPVRPVVSNSRCAAAQFYHVRL